MDSELAKSLLKGSKKVSLQTVVSLQQQRAFLVTINNILSKRLANYVMNAEIVGDGADGCLQFAKDVEEWADCLNIIPQSHVALYPDVAQRLMHLCAFLNQRVTQQYLIPGNNSLETFLTRKDV